MPTLKAIKKRIGSVSNTQKVTRAMQMIAAARLRKAHEAALNARGFAEHVKEIAVRIAKRSGTAIHPFLQPYRTVQKIEFLVLTSDRRLCGGCNENLLRRLSQQWKEYRDHNIDVTATVIGRKGDGFLKLRGHQIGDTKIGFYETLEAATVRELLEPIVARFLEGEIDHLILVYNRFRTAMTQDITLESVLPMVPEQTETAPQVDYIYEPSRDEVVEGLLKSALIARVHQACLESIAGELGSRMVAMDNATKNAGEMIDTLTMQYNRARQASITKDLLDIVNGSESLKK